MRRAFRLRLASCAAAWLGLGMAWAQQPAVPAVNQPGSIASAPWTEAELAALPPDQGVPPHVPQGQRCEPSPDQLETEPYLKRLQRTPAVDLNVFDVLLMQRALPLMAERLRAGANPNVCGGQSNISLLAQAALFGSTAMVQLLLDHGAQLEWPAYAMVPAVPCAAQRGRARQADAAPAQLRRPQPTGEAVVTAMPCKAERRAPSKRQARALT